MNSLSITATAVYNNQGNSLPFDIGNTNLPVSSSYGISTGQGISTGSWVQVFTGSMVGLQAAFFNNNDISSSISIALNNTASIASIIKPNLSCYIAWSGTLAPTIFAKATSGVNATPILTYMLIDN